MTNGYCRFSLLGIALMAAHAAPPDDFRISGPYTHENLSVFLLHSSRPTAASKLLTLQEAMDRKLVAVFETGQVDQLAIENVSREAVFIQAGDIVKGGQQDRVLTTDLLLAPRSGRVQIASYCVEQGRWSKRGGEDAKQFSASSMAAPGRELKMAVREKNSQAKVWLEVASMGASLGSGAGLARAAGGAVGNARNAGPNTIASSSLQLNLENQPVAAATGNYVSKLSTVLDGKTDVVGYAYSVNGKLSSAETYVSADLFRRMWPKLLQSSAAEAIAERSKQKAPVAAAAPDVKKVLADADTVRPASTETRGQISVVKRESPKVLLYETNDRNTGGAVLHKSYIVK